MRWLSGGRKSFGASDSSHAVLPVGLCHCSSSGLPFFPRPLSSRVHAQAGLVPAHRPSTLLMSFPEGASPTGTEKETHPVLEDDAEAPIQHTVTVNPSDQSLSVTVNIRLKPRRVLRSKPVLPVSEEGRQKSSRESSGGAPQREGQKPQASEAHGAERKSLQKNSASIQSGASAPLPATEQLVKYLESSLGATDARQFVPQGWEVVGGDKPPPPQRSGPIAKIATSVRERRSARKKYDSSGNWGMLQRPQHPRVKLQPPRPSPPPPAQQAQVASRVFNRRSVPEWATEADLNNASDILPAPRAPQGGLAQGGFSPRGSLVAENGPSVSGRSSPNEWCQPLGHSRRPGAPEGVPRKVWWKKGSESRAASGEGSGEGSGDGSGEGSGEGSSVEELTPGSSTEVYWEGPLEGSREGSEEGAPLKGGSPQWVRSQRLQKLAKSIMLLLVRKEIGSMAEASELALELLQLLPPSSQSMESSPENLDEMLESGSELVLYENDIVELIGYLCKQGSVGVGVDMCEFLDLCERGYQVRSMAVVNALLRSCRRRLDTYHISVITKRLIDDWKLQPDAETFRLIISIYTAVGDSKAVEYHARRMQDAGFKLTQELSRLNPGRILM